MKKIFITILLLLNFYSFSQKHELDRVTIDELKEKVCPMDTSAVAAVLFDVGEVKFDYSDNDGFVIKFRVKTKIKIYKKEGYEWANKSLRYYIGNNGNENVVFSNEATYNLVNGKIEKTKLKSDGKFEEKTNKFWAQKKITLPNVREGSVIEYEYIYTTDNFGSLQKWFFQSSIPILYSEYKTTIPEYFIYKPAFSGYISPLIVTDRNSRTITSTSKVRVGWAPRTIFSTDNLTFSEAKTIYTLENIPAIKEEAYVNNIKNYIASLELELLSIKYPDEPIKNYTTDWETVTKKIYESEGFGDELKKTGYFEKDLDALLDGLTSDVEKIGIIFSYVKSRLNWNEFAGIYCDDGVRKAYQDKTGNDAEINLMLTAMLRYAGIEANPILLSTRSNGISLFPSRTSFNYVITGVELQDQIILLDATNKFSLPNVLPIRDLNWMGRIIRKDGTSAVVNLMPTSNSKEIVNVMAAISTQAEITGKIRAQYFDYNAFIYRDANNGVSKDSYTDKLEKKYHGLEISELSTQNSNDLSLPIIENYSFISNNSVEVIGDKMYVSPLLFFATTENPFKQETREYPVDFIYPKQNKYIVSLTIPDGYVVETLPQSAAVSMPDKYGDFKYLISNNGNQVQLIYTQDNNQAIIGSEDYEVLKNYYKEIVNKQAEKIVLKKV